MANLNCSGAATPSRNGRSRSNTAHSYSDRFTRVDEEPEPEAPRLTIPARLPSRDQSHERAVSGISTRPSYHRSNTADGRTDSTRDYSPAPRLSRMPTEPTALLAGRTQVLRPVRPRGADVFSDSPQDDEGSSPDRYFNDRSDSPTSYGGSIGSRAASFTEVGSVGSVKKAPPPPPPSRAKKPPPPPPMKRSTLSSSEVPRA